MLTIREHHSGDLFDPWAHLDEKRKRLLERSWAGVFRTHLLQRLPVGEPEMLLADTHYGSNQNIDCAAKRDVALISPAMTPKGAKEGKFTFEQFKLDKNGLVTKCPAGHPPIAVSTTAKRLQARFDDMLCHRCPQSRHCPTRTPRSHGEGSRFQ